MTISASDQMPKRSAPSRLMSSGVIASVAIIGATCASPLKPMRATKAPGRTWKSRLERRRMLVNRRSSSGDPFRGEQLAIDQLGPLGDHAERELRDRTLARALAEAPAQVRRLRQPNDRFGDRSRSSRRDEKAVDVVRHDVAG